MVNVKCSDVIKMLNAACKKQWGRDYVDIRSVISDEVAEKIIFAAIEVLVREYHEFRLINDKDSNLQYCEFDEESFFDR